MLLTIAGKPGSGKSVVAKRLSDDYDLELVSFGAIFRRKAEEAGLSLEEFSKYAEEHGEVDREVDREQLDYIRRGNCVLDSRLGGHLAWREGAPSIKIYLKASLEVRAHRIAKRENIGMEEAKTLIEGREKSEKRRYLDFYSIDIDDLAPYDLIINSELLTEDGLFLSVKAFVDNCRLADGP